MLVEKTGLNVALDESLDRVLLSGGSGIPSLEALLAESPPAAIILKPAVAGGFTRCLAIARIAAKHNTKVSSAPKQPAAFPSV